MANNQRYAQVIVDVPTMQVNHPFDYIIPSQWANFVTPGMRVQVPFGVREVLGFVVEVSDESNIDHELKSISAVLDDEPVLTSEMLQLGKELATQLFTFQILCFQTMIPNLLKVDYTKVFVPLPTISWEHQQQFFSSQKEVSWDAANQNQQLATLMQLKSAGEVAVEYRLKDKKKIKKAYWIQPLLDYEELQEVESQLRPQATKQQDLVAVLMDLDGENISAKQLKASFNLSMQTIRSGERKGWLTVFEKEEKRDPYADLVTETVEPKTLFPEQQQAFNRILPDIHTHRHEVFLLQGVTGSGKTEVYLQLIQAARDLDKTALLLVPEIGLTPQMVNQLKGRFGNDVAVLHSQLTAGERFDEWRKLKHGEAHIAVGARSSIFAPLDNLGIIIIDEEHETTYKQNNAPRYHAREVAKWRGNYHQCPVVLGSATPSLETRARAQNGVYERLTLTKRTNHHELPDVQIVDMREEFKHKNYYQFSRKLRDAITETLARHEQVALMLNRRGYANYIQCMDCGHVFQCPNCDVSLTRHNEDKTLKCHYCGHTEALPQFCPECRGHHLQSFGTGTEKVEQEIMELFPEANVVRMDNDTTRRKGSHQKILNKVANHEADILLGTQMIAKGLDFPNITLVGIINADTSLYLPNFRASEQTFQLITQMSGRAGRGDLPGQVFVQTFNPEHYALQFAKAHDYEKFYAYEMRYRKLNHYSPYVFTIRLTVSHFDEKTGLRTAFKIRRLLQEADVQQTRILGPSQSAIARINNQYYFQVLYHYRNRHAIQPILETIKNKAQEWDRDHIHVMMDVEPMSFM
ncbi:primosomal protein N' [Aerococcus suis]